MTRGCSSNSCWRSSSSNPPWLHGPFRSRHGASRGVAEAQQRHAQFVTTRNELEQIKSTRESRTTTYQHRGETAREGEKKKCQVQGEPKGGTMGPLLTVLLVPRKARSEGPRYSPPHHLNRTPLVRGQKLSVCSIAQHLSLKQLRHAQSTPGLYPPLSRQFTLQKQTATSECTFTQIITARSQKNATPFTNELIPPHTPRHPFTSRVVSDARALTPRSINFPRRCEKAVGEMPRADKKERQLSGTHPRSPKCGRGIK